MKPFVHTIDALEADMIACEQTSGLNVLEHGKMVAKAYKQLISTIQYDEFLFPLYQMTKHMLPDAELMERYHIYHDCGKPYVKDETGRFPGHEFASAVQWKMLNPKDDIVVDLIHKDMLFHSARGDDVAQIWFDPLAPALYFTAWAELYANAEMFGGLESDSFKIKRKRLLTAGKKGYIILSSAKK